MEKDFDSWNKQKKQVNVLERSIFYHEREIWWCRLGINIGFEQDGKGSHFLRPVLILRAFNTSACLIVPLTSSNSANPYKMKAGIIESKETFVIISQLRFIDTKRFIEKIGYVDKQIFNEIRKAVKNII